MKALATHRHHPMALLAIILMALIATGGLFAVLSPKDASAEAFSASDIAEGKKLFVSNCATCHGMNGEGRKDSDGNTVGSSLIGVGAAAVDFQVGTGRMPMQESGPQAQRKPVQFTDKQISQLAAYVASLGPGPSIPTEEQLSKEGADVTKGGEIFRINCAMCHSASAAGGALTEGKWAPTLRDVEDKHIYEAMESGPQNMPVFNDNNLSPEDKRDVIAYLNQLEENGSPGGYSLGALGPVTEGLFAWTAILAILLGCAIWLGAKAK